MPLEADKLMEFLAIVDKELKEPVELTAVGGTAMTLLGLKDSTIDIDFDVETKHLERFRKTLESISHGYTIDLFHGGMVFSQQLPQDWTDKRIPIKRGFKNIRLYALHPLDIVVSKIGRLNDRDISDIRSCIKKHNLTKQRIKSRAKRVEYVGNDENYKANLKYVIENLYSED